MPGETTGAVVAAVRHRRDQDPGRHERLLDRIEDMARGLREPSWSVRKKIRRASGS